MQSILTVEALDFIPEPIRLKLGLTAGTVLEFDETVPFLKAVPAAAQTSDDFATWLTASTGLARGLCTTDEPLRETRGED